MVGVGVGELLIVGETVGDCVGVGVEVLEFVGVKGYSQSSSTTIVYEKAVLKLPLVVQSLLRCPGANS